MVYEKAGIILASLSWIYLRGSGRILGMAKGDRVLDVYLTMED